MLDVPHTAATEAARQPIPMPPPELLTGIEFALSQYFPGHEPKFLERALKAYLADNTEVQPGPRPLLSAKEAANHLGLSAMSFHRLMNTGKIPVVRLGPRRIGIDPDDLAAFIESRKTVAGKKRRRRKGGTR